MAVLTVLAVLAVVAVSVVTATPLKPNPLFRRPDKTTAKFKSELGSFAPKSKLKGSGLDEL